MPRDMHPDAARFEATLRRLRRRTWMGDFVWAVTAGVATAALMHALAFHDAAWFGSATAAGIAGHFLRRRRTTERAAALLERAVPASRNTIVTAEELLRYPERASQRVLDLVMSRAADLTADVSLAQVHSLTRPIVAFALILALALLVPSGRTVVRSAADAIRDRSASSGGGVPRVSVTIEPPPYARLPRTVLSDPERIDALTGSRAVLRMRGDGSQWRVRFGDRPLAWMSDSSVTVELNDSGYFALERTGQRTGDGRLIPVTVIPDRAPAVAIEAPARDLVLPDASRTLSVSASASDDLAVSSLELRYTKVSGTGEDFEFVEGTLPVSLARTSDREWKLRADVALGTLGLEPGDSLVYRAVAKDQRPGAAGEASSDTYFVEIAGPGQVALEGFALPPDQERYALSQQMVVLKIERLRARERTMARDAVREASAAIAAEQRAVRANFIFLMGGHVEDEEVEAEQSNEIQEGRLENSARREISTAVHFMTRAEQGLMSSSTDTALPPAKSAVEALQRAFGRNRYILRTPPSRAEIDPSRRLAGTLSDASRWRRDLLPPERDAKGARIDAFLSAALACAARLDRGASVEPESFAALGERALAVGASERQWQQVALRLAALGDRARGGARAADLLAELNIAVKPAIDAALAGARGPVPKGTDRAGALARAWADEQRR